MRRQKLLNFSVAGAFQAGGEFVVGQIRRQRIAAQGIGISEVGAGIAFGQGAFGLVVQLALLGQVCGLCGLHGATGEKQAG